jgi:hypothetical protein
MLQYSVVLTHNKILGFDKYRNCIDNCIFTVNTQTNCLEMIEQGEAYEITIGQINLLAQHLLHMQNEAAITHLNDLMHKIMPSYRDLSQQEAYANVAITFSSSDITQDDNARDMVTLLILLARYKMYEDNPDKSANLTIDLAQLESKWEDIKILFNQNANAPALEKALSDMKNNMPQVFNQITTTEESPLAKVLALNKSSSGTSTPSSTTAGTSTKLPALSNAAKQFILQQLKSLALIVMIDPNLGKSGGGSPEFVETNCKTCLTDLTTKLAKFNISLLGDKIYPIQLAFNGATPAASKTMAQEFSALPTMTNALADIIILGRGTPSLSQVSSPSVSNRSLTANAQMEYKLARALSPPVAASNTSIDIGEGTLLSPQNLTFLSEFAHPSLFNRERLFSRRMSFDNSFPNNMPTSLQIPVPTIAVQQGILVAAGEILLPESNPVSRANSFSRIDSSAPLDRSESMDYYENHSNLSLGSDSMLIRSSSQLSRTSSGISFGTPSPFSPRSFDEGQVYPLDSVGEEEIKTPSPPAIPRNLKDEPTVADILPPAPMFPMLQRDFHALTLFAPPLAASHVNSDVPLPPSPSSKPH